jgi:hypothetical protein
MVGDSPIPHFQLWRDHPNRKSIKNLNYTLAHRDLIDIYRTFFTRVAEKCACFSRVKVKAFLR